VLGAGGAARAAAWALREAGASEVSVWNRTPERAESLAREFGVRAVRKAGPADLLVNCTPVGLERPGPPRAAPLPGLEPSASEREELNQLGLSFDQVGEYSYVVDMAYRQGPTHLLAAARRHGARTLDGLEILVAQGALSFELWTGRKAPLDVMRRAAREQNSPVQE
jgi:shikimate dehydrogenase